MSVAAINDTAAVARFSSAINASLAARGLRLSVETPASIRQLRDRHGRFTHSPYISDDLESLIVDAYVDSIFDDQLECLTIRDSSSDECGAVCFYRQCDADEMHGWLKPEFRDWVKSNRSLTSMKHDHDRDHGRALILPALNDSDNDNDNASGMLVVDQSADTTGMVVALRSRADALAKRRQRQLQLSTDLRDDNWVKIELLATSPLYQRQGLASLLCSCVLLIAYMSHPTARTHSILHVAGGPSNTAAESFYEKLGFRRVPQHFANEPNRNLWAGVDVGFHIAEEWVTRAKQRPQLMQQPSLLLTSSDNR